MLSENIRSMRRARQLSQEELAVRLHVVRQTVSKWEQGLSVPDADLLIALAQALDTSVSTLLGETVEQQAAPDEVGVLAERLEQINATLAHGKALRRRVLHAGFLALAVLIALLFAGLIAWKSPYLSWSLADPETAVFSAALHTFEYLFVRCAPLLFIGAIVGAVRTRTR